MNNFTEGDTLTLVRLPVIDFVGLKYYFENMVDANISLEKLYNQYLGYRKTAFQLTTETVWMDTLGRFFNNTLTQLKVRNKPIEFDTD